MSGNDKNKQVQVHKFWDTQPVPKISDDVKDWGFIEPPFVPSQEPVPLLKQFAWCTCNVDDEKEIEEIYTLLTNNYVEDDDNMFRFNYSKEFLRWALKSPGWRSELHVGVRVKESGKLVGFITGVPARIRCNQKEVVPLVEINFLCVHKKLRSKRLAPVLIKEVTRRVQCGGVFHAVYTAGVVLPRPVASCRYWHRSLNPKKLIEVNFSRLGPRTKMSQVIKMYKLPAAPELPGIRPMEEKDAGAVQKILAQYLAKFKVAPVFDVNDVKHMLLPQEGVVYSYVVETGGKITDFVSFYCLPSSVLGHAKYDTLKAAYLFYYAATASDLQALMKDAMIYAVQNDFDVFNALDILDNSEFLKSLKFGIGDGFLQYYLYNYRAPTLDPNAIGLVML